MGIRSKLSAVLAYHKHDKWETCKHCGGKVIFIMPKWYEELFKNRLGTLQCSNCGQEEYI